MKITIIANETPTQEMTDWFEKRTKNHIKLVQKYAEIISKNFPQYKELIAITEKHDKSKFEDPEFHPYIYTTWQYKLKGEGRNFVISDFMLEKMNNATNHHVKNNKHHPEFWTDNKEENLINKDDRDKKSDKIVDATKMKDIYIAEMCADWCAVSEERGSSPVDWADKNGNIRWKFTDKQKDIIYKILNAVWEIHND